MTSVQEAKNEAWKMAQEIAAYVKKFDHHEGLKKMYKNAFRD